MKINIIKQENTVVLTADVNTLFTTLSGDVPEKDLQEAEKLINCFQKEPSEYNRKVLIERIWSSQNTDGSNPILLKAIRNHTSNNARYPEGRIDLYSGAIMYFNTVFELNEYNITFVDVLSSPMPFFVFKDNQHDLFFKKISGDKCNALADLFLDGLVLNAETAALPRPQNWNNLTWYEQQNTYRGMLLQQKWLEKQK